jgi:probable HAF family extracellular repeat protein
MRAKPWLVFSTLVLLNVPVEARPRYAVTKINLPFEAWDLRINNAGLIAGTAYGGLAFVHANGVSTYLGALPGHTNSTVAAIDSLGQIVGESYTSETSHPFIYSNGVMTALGDSSMEKKSVSDINDAGQVVGGSEGDVYDPGTPYLYDNGTLSALDSFLGEAGHATAINNVGEVVGAISTTGLFGPSQAFVYRNGERLELGTLPGDVRSSAQDINDAGQIVGTSSSGENLISEDYTSRAFLYANGVMTDLGGLGGPTTSAIAINNRGQILAMTTRPQKQPAYLAESIPILFENGHLLQLNKCLPEGWELSAADAINDDGLIVGFGKSPKGKSGAILLTPLPLVTISGGKNLVSRTPKVTVRGRGNFIVSSIAYQVNGRGGFKRAQGTSRWHFVASLKPGPNRLVIRAHSLYGHTDETRLTVIRK